MYESKIKYYVGVVFFLSLGEIFFQLRRGDSLFNDRLDDS